MNKRNLVTAAAATKLVIFTLVSIIVTGTLAAIMGGLGFGKQTDYRAVFSSASELQKGDDVRVAGVKVGEVKSVEIYRKNQALITFKVQRDVPVTSSTLADIRFMNLVGDRYVALRRGDGQGSRLSAGGTIPMKNTTPALNLTALFNGFQPLFAALDPKDVNQLAMNLIKVLQGEGGTVQQLLQRTASLTNTLADRDKLIGDVVNNLDATVRMVDGRRKELHQLIIGLRGWSGQLARDRGSIGNSVQKLSDLSATLSDLLTRTRPLIKSDVAELRRLFAILNRPENKAQLDRTLKLLPTMLARQTRIGTYGSWYNYYLCEFQGGVVLPKEVMSTLPQPLRGQLEKALGEFTLYSKAERCR